VIRKLALLMALVAGPTSAEAGVVYRDRWYPDGVVRYLNVDAANLAPGALEAVADYFRTHTPIDIRAATPGVFEPNLRLRALGGFGLAMTPGYLDPAWPDALKTLFFERAGTQSADTIAHELMHALGFAHEQQRPDRDQWVHVCFNLDPFNYGLVGPAPYALTSPYDYASIMHYEVPCVTPTHPADMTPRYRGRPTLLSRHDVNSLYRAYEPLLGAAPPDASAPSARGDFDDDGYEDVARVGLERHGAALYVWLYFTRGVATDPSEGLPAVVQVQWFRQLVTVAWRLPKVVIAAGDRNGDGIADLDVDVGRERWRVIVNAPGDGWAAAPWGRKGVVAIVRRRHQT